MHVTASAVILKLCQSEALSKLKELHKALISLTAFRAGRKLLQRKYMDDHFCFKLKAL